MENTKILLDLLFHPESGGVVCTCTDLEKSPASLRHGKATIRQIVITDLNSVGLGSEAKDFEEKTAALQEVTSVQYVVEATDELMDMFGFNEVGIIVR